MLAALRVCHCGPDGYVTNCILGHIARVLDELVYLDAFSTSRVEQSCNALNICFVSVAEQCLEERGGLLPLVVFFGWCIRVDIREAGTWARSVMAGVREMPLHTRAEMYTMMQQWHYTAPPVMTELLQIRASTARFPWEGNALDAVYEVFADGMMSVSKRNYQAALHAGEEHATLSGGL